MFATVAPNSYCQACFFDFIRRLLVEDWSFYLILISPWLKVPPLVAPEFKLPPVLEHPIPVF
jgi:hypothetical protein